jgi:hypothetical protein
VVIFCTGNSPKICTKKKINNFFSKREQMENKPKSRKVFLWWWDRLKSNANWSGECGGGVFLWLVVFVLGRIKNALNGL